MWLLIIGSVIIFGYYALQGDRFIDGDSYFYLAQYNISPVLIKLIYCELFICTLLIIVKIGELFDKEKGYLLAFIMYGFTFFVSEFWKFENDVFGYFFGFIGLYLSLYCWIKKDWVIGSLAIPFFLIGIYFWQGVLAWLVISVLFNPMIIVIVLVGFFLFINRFFDILNIRSNPNIIEGTPFIAIIYFGLTIFFLFGVIKTKARIIIATIILCIPALMYAKFYVLPLVFLCLIAFNGLKMFKVDTTKFLVVFCFLMTFFWISSLDKQFPTMNDLDLIKYSSKIEGLQNSFGSGWILEYYGGKPTGKSGFGGLGKDYNLSGLVLLEAFDSNCPILRQTEHLILVDCNH